MPDFKGSYLASNLDIYNPETGELQPLAPRFKKFTTKNQGIRILAFGFVFDFTGNANNTVITTVKDTVEKDWFKEAIGDKELDLIVVFGHVDIRSHEYPTLYAAIRKAQWDTPIQFFGGHTHVRDYKIFDRKSVALESGRYMVSVINWDTGIVHFVHTAADTYEGDDRLHVHQRPQHRRKRIAARQTPKLQTIILALLHGQQPLLHASS